MISISTAMDLFNGAMTREVDGARLFHVDAIVRDPTDVPQQASRTLLR